jgi:hypothetical protein
MAPEPGYRTTPCLSHEVAVMMKEMRLLGLRQQLEDGQAPLFRLAEHDLPDPPLHMGPARGQDEPGEEGGVCGPGLAYDEIH